MNQFGIKVQTGSCGLSPGLLLKGTISDLLLILPIDCHCCGHSEGEAGGKRRGFAEGPPQTSRSIFLTIFNIR
jgi:hypothetical protein